MDGRQPNQQQQHHDRFGQVPTPPQYSSSPDAHGTTKRRYTVDSSHQHPRRASSSSRSGRHDFTENMTAEELAYHLNQSPHASFSDMLGGHASTISPDLSSRRTITLHVEHPHPFFPLHPLPIKLLSLLHPGFRNNHHPFTHPSPQHRSLPPLRCGCFRSP
ncbi:hypothetical protein BC829DRAFT_227963 [Chytridium lagenaria]|nr:hypothetical protein BC829DRAFT_227963 [Chytridium lagenaria]